MSMAKKLPQSEDESGVHWPHLSQVAKDVMDGPVERRLDFLMEPRWIGYPLANLAIADLDALCRHPPTNRPPCRLILGATNNGKTDIMRRFEKRHPRTERPDGGGMLIPVLYVISPSGPDEKGLYANILRRIGVPFGASSSARQLFAQVLKVSAEVGLKVLLIDEIHNVLAGNSAKHRGFLKTLKTLSGELQVPIVCAGTVKAFNAMQSEPEVGNRFKPIPIPPWTMGKDFRALLASFEKVLPLQLPSNLSEDEALATKILIKSEGRIGEMTNLLAEAARLAITSKLERIDSRVLDSANFTPPQKRKELPNGLD